MHAGSDNRTNGLRTGVRGCLALLLTLLLPTQSLAAAAAPAKGAKAPARGAVTARWPAAAQQNAAAKIDPSVAEAFASRSQVTYFVKMRAKADVTGVAAAARSSAEPALRELSARSGVIQALKRTAESSQGGLLQDLKKEQAKGSVTRFEPYWVTNLVAVTSSRDAMERIARRSDVERIILDQPIHLVGQKAGTRSTAVTSATSVTPASVEWGIQRVGAPSVWSQFGIDGTGSVVASIDTGVDWTHPALRDRWRGYDPGTGATDPTYSWFDAVNGQSMPYDDHGHGTHTTGTMVGQDGENVIGVAPGARWISAKILDAGGSGSTENIIRAGQWILAPGGDPSKAPDVASNSWGGGPGMDEWFREVVQAWRAAGIVPVFANGNDGPGDGTAGEPGNYPEAIAVGAIDINDDLAGFSSRGPSPYGEIKPELSAPGVNVRSSVPGGGYEGSWSGTSMATPHVTGTVALLRQANASLTVDQIEEILTSSADPKTDAEYPDVPNNGYGHGILNAYTAVGMVISGIGSVSGRVLTSGDDAQPPVIQHTPVTEAFKGEQLGIVADVSDNIAVTAVRLKFRLPSMTWWGETEMTRSAGDYLSGTYSGAIPPEMLTGDSVQYYIEAQDFGGNTASDGTAAHPHAVRLLNGLTPGYIQDFEGSAPGWSHGGTADSWAIGVPTSGPNSAHGGARVAATNLGGDYQNGSDSWLMLPPIDLSGGQASLRYWQWYAFEQGYDNGFVIASADGQNWDVLRQITGADGGWQQDMISLAAYAGSPHLYVAFYLISDGSVTAPGWYLDDVELFVDNEPPAAPANLQAQPTPAGSVVLTWDAVSAPDLDHYGIYRSSTSGSGYAKLADATATGYTDAGTTSGSTYYYVVSATDTSGHESAMSAEASATVNNVQVRFRDDMESGEGGWTHSGANDPWQLGAPTSGPGSANSGANVWATNLGGNYQESTNASLVTPAIDLSGLSAASLQFAHWYSLERNYDFGYVEITTDGGAHWTELARYTAPASGGRPVGWETPMIDLTPYAGNTVQIRFRLQSDSSVNYPGWYLDDVTVAGSPTASGTASLSLSTREPDLSGNAKPKPANISPKPVINRTSATAGQVSRSTTATGSSIGIQSLPLDATVTVVETGRVVRTSPADGSFHITLPAGSYTLRAQAYGHFPQERSVTVADGTDTSVTFQLERIPHGTITGTVTDARTGSPLQGATVSVNEDLRITPVTTDAQGHYVLDVLQGDYTVEVRQSGYYPNQGHASVGANASVRVDVALRPFIGMPGEIAYDDGSADNAWAFLEAGNGWGVRMTPTSGQSVLVRGARFYLWDDSWPQPGGNSFRAAIVSANPDGSPGQVLAGPVRVTNAIRGGWNDVDFSAYGVTVTGDFYIAYIQDQAGESSPGMAVDESTRDSGRNWYSVSGTWQPWDGGGNFMIRALVSYAVGAPVITSPTNGSYTNQPQAHVTGTAFAGTTVTLLRDGAQAAQVQAGADGNWGAALTLAEGPNHLTATATVSGGGTTDPSAPVTVTLDTILPALSVAAPTDGQSQTSRIIQVNGTVSDTNLGSVQVNGQPATADSSGRFAIELIGQDGSNTVVVVASDLAGNSTQQTRIVHVDSSAPTIANMQPASDRNLSGGDSLTVAFDSEPGLALAAFSIIIDPTGGTAAGGSVTSLEPGEMAMREVTAGHYEAQWTVPAGYAASTAYVRLRAVDGAGNETRATAPGVLQFANVQAPTAVITGPTSGRINEFLGYDGSRSSDPDGRIVSYHWQFSDGGTADGSRVRHRFTRPGTYTVTLTVTDDMGLIGTATLTVTVPGKR
jgi:bacillopeptidase F (M6 metalloprotease family)/subtilisin family serine protease